ncbi:acetate--CoA ligase family protein [Roseovarius sp. SK2]|uniref:acetate--CoA ligase family protein n=1 Tax=Roseovarius TaxID=74030 RepID=UPI00237B4D78|nr:acetate--CoA ligase family protein [Roseovarius sp. SK2]MDD9726943.1 acetate--CoA ligase family protein [Roseovarius sp. SK2]
MNSIETTTANDDGIRALLNPRSVAIVGASEDQAKFSGRITHYLLKHSYAGDVYLINPSRETLFGRRAYPSLDDLPATPDVVLIGTPKPTIAGMIDKAGQRGAKVVVVISSGFADAGDKEGEAALAALAKSHGMRLIGPNVMGFASPVNNLAMMSSHVLKVDRLRTGNIGIVSQSGGVLSALMDFVEQHGFGISHAFPTGNQADVDFCDLVGGLVDDPMTQVICTYVEGLSSPSRFIETARRVRASGKTWLMMKSGRTEAGMEAAFSHTASLASSHDAFTNICRDNGIVLFDDFESFVTATLLVSHSPAARIDRIGVVSPSGGSCVMTADLFSDMDLPMAEFGPATRAALPAYFPDDMTNPVDTGAAVKDPIVGANGPVTQAIVQDPAVSLLLGVISTCPDVRLVSQLVADGAGDTPHLLVIQPAAMADEARAYLRENAIPYTDSLHGAARAIRALRAAGTRTARTAAIRPEGCALPADLPSGPLDEKAAKALLESYGIRTNTGRLATDAESARGIAAGLTAPLVLKVVSPDVVHKADVGGVMLDIDGPEAMADAVRAMRARLEQTAPDAEIHGFLVQEQATGLAEVMIGVQHDDLFGAMIMVGAGGGLVELLADVATASVPVSPEDAKRMLGTLKIARILEGVRGQPPLDMDAVADAISRTSWLAHDLGGRLRELDINPLFVAEAGKGAVAVDARALMAPATA